MFFLKSPCKAVLEISQLLGESQLHATVSLIHVHHCPAPFLGLFISFLSISFDGDELIVKITDRNFYKFARGKRFNTLQVLAIPIHCINQHRGYHMLCFQNICS